MRVDTFNTARTRSSELSDMVTMFPERYRLVSGDRPTGPLHLGHYFGTLTERVRLQNLGVKTFLIVADYQVITDRDNMAHVKQNVANALLDYLAAGIDPQRATILVHSAVPALNQLMLPFLSLVTEADLHRNPTVKAEAASSRRPLSGLLLTYPVHQAADILFCKGNLVPVGKDNLPHVEQARVIARRFNERYGSVFPEPVGMITSTPELPGLDGRKMSKSYGNAISLRSGPDETAALIRRARTDSLRHITFDPENRPGVAALLTTAALCLNTDPRALADQIGEGGSGKLKQLVTESVNTYLAPHRRRRRELAQHIDHVHNILRQGNERANEVAEATLTEIRTAMGTDY